ncbi:MAG TPA: SdrD B-like domain-containing protein [Gemmatales bacterium]|nr:SdrD B-like domain-containing protein [Gemmatales bacterium]
MYVALNVLNKNSVNGLFVQFSLDLARGIDQNLPSVGGVMDDTDIVTVIDGQALIVRPDQYFAMMSQRTVTPDPTSGGYLQKFNNANTFLSSLVLRLPGNLPTNTTLPMNLPLQRGPQAVNPGLVDSGLFYYQTNFDTTARNAVNSDGTLQRGEEWRDWGVNFAYAGSTSNINDPLRPFATVADPSNPGGFMLKTDTLDGNGSYDMVFPDAVSAVGFWIVNNQSTSPTQRIQLLGVNGQIIESAPMPTTTANGRSFFGRVSKTPIYKVRIIDDAGDAVAPQSSFTTGSINVSIPGNGTNAEATINVPTAFNLSDVRVNLSITHAKASDLILELVAPDGTVVQLANRTGGTVAGANYTNTNFSNSFTTPITAGLAPFSGNFYPVSFDPFAVGATGLATLNGKLAQGNWKLRVRNAAADGVVGGINNVTLTFKAPGLTLNNPGITGLTWVSAGASLTVKANSVDTVITAGSIASGFNGVTQNAAGVITNGFLPQMMTLENGTGATGQFTFGQSTNTSFTMNTPTPLLTTGGDNIVPLQINSDFVASDLTVTLNLAYSEDASNLRVRLRAPDGSEIELVGAGQTMGKGGFLRTTFDDKAEQGLTSINVNTFAQFTAPYDSTVDGTFQSWSFTNTENTAPTTNTPFGLGFYRGKDIKGTWAIVVNKSDITSATLNSFTLRFRAPVSGWGSTLRIMGQGSYPVVLTGVKDDSVGAGPIGNKQPDTNNDGPSVSSAGQWQGVQLLAGINSSISDVVTQNPNGTLNRRYADLNPYTRGDEGLTYPGLNNPNGLLLSTQDALYNSLAGTSGGTTVTTRASFDSVGAANLQDGTLVEFADIRFATIGIDVRGYPKTKLTIDGNEFEQSATPNGSLRTSELTNPTPQLRVNQFNQEVFATTDGTYTVAGRLGGTGDGIFTDDVDWYELPHTTPFGDPVQMYIDIERGRNTAGNDQPINRKISIAVFNNDMQLLWWSGQAGGGYFDNTRISGNTLGPITLLNGDIPYIPATGFAQDATFIAVMPFDRIPRSFVPAAASPPGLQPANTTYIFSPFQADKVSPPTFPPPPRPPFPTPGSSADGGALFLVDQNGAIQTVTNDSIYDTGALDGTSVGGYEMQLRFDGFERQDNPTKPAEGQILIRSNTVQNAAGDGISLRDLRMIATNTSMGLTMPLQAARYPASQPTTQGNSSATNLAVNSSGNPLRNEDINNVNPAFSAPANFVPGIDVQNNLIVKNGGDGISLREDRNTNAISPGNALTPTAFSVISNNTIDRNGGSGINLITRGGPSVQNNIVSNNGSGITITDGYDISSLTPAVVPSVSYNIFYNNANSGTFTGSQNLIGSGTTNDPLYVDPLGLDYRVRLASPAIDSAISDLQDRLRSMRVPQVPTRAPNIDLRGRSRVDNPSRPNVGSGAFPFYDRGALEANEQSLRVIGLSVLSDNNILGSPITSISVVFAGRVDISTFKATSVSLHIGSTSGTVIPLNFNLMTASYDKFSDTHSFSIPLTNGLLSDGTYYLVIGGTSVANAVLDVAGQLLDGEFPAPYNLPSGDGASGGDFIYPFSIRTASISGNVWRNDNGNGSIDAGEPGIGSVGLVLHGTGPDGLLFTADDTIVANTTSSATGAYSFLNLASGSYYVTVNNATLPNSSYILNTPPAQKVVNLPIGGIRSNLNFGFWIDTGNGVVSGKLFDDVNGNGSVDAGEGAVKNGVTPVHFLVTLTSGGADFDLSTTADNITYTTTSDDNGNYTFQGTVADPIYGNNYRIDVDESVLPAGYLRTSPLVIPVSFSITPGGTRSQNYGYQLKQATINGLVFSDDDGSGTLNGVEGGINGVTVRLLGAGLDGVFNTPDDLPTLTTTTSGNGNYSFNPLTAGKYQVVVDSSSVVLANYYLTTGNTTQTITLANGSAIQTAANVGYRLDPMTGQILGRVFNDLNANGQYDGGEPGFNNVNVQLRWAGRDGILNNSDDQVFNATTIADGSWTKTGLPVGDYYIQPTSGVPAGFGLTTPASLPLKITLGFAGVNTSGFFGYQAANSSISGFVFNDLDGNGTVQGGETGRFSGVRVYLDLNSNGSFDPSEPNAFSAANTGAFTISNLPAGTYQLKIDTATLPPSVPAGFVASTGTITVPLAASSNVSGQNLGLQQRNGQVIGRAFLDTNSNGLFDGGEVGSPNRTITLKFTGSTIPANFATTQTFTSLSDGTFSFTGLPAGTYTVETDLPTGGTIPNPPNNPQAINLSAGASSSNLFPIQFPGSQTAGVWYMTFAGANTTLTNSDGSTTVVKDTDIVRLTSPAAGQWRYDVFFQGSNFGLTSGNESIDAFTFTKAGDIIISTKNTFSVSTTYASNGNISGPAITGLGEDLIKFTPSGPNTGSGIQGGVWSMFFDGSDVQLSGSSENVDAVSLVYSGNTISKVLISTTGQASVPGIVANPQDVMSFTPTSLGATTSGTFKKYFIGTTAANGLNDNINENVDALFFLPNPSDSTKPSLFMSTAGSFNVPSLTGNKADILRYDVTGASGTTVLGSFTSIALPSNSFGHGATNVTGFYMGGVATDPDPFGNSGSSSAPSFAQLLSAQPSAAGFSAIGSSTANSAKVVQALTTGSSSTKTVSNQADQFFTVAKRQPATPVKNLALSLLSRFK